uniref:Gnk2-homologous domain-containing protein n=1 Tax=Setaria italica TaxID=4555 RepID=K3ZCG3_SETIT
MGTRRPTRYCFSSHIAGVAAALILAALHAPPPPILAQEQLPPWLLCGPAPASSKCKANGSYQANINQLSATLPKNTSSTTGSAGSSAPDVVYALALCRGDANASACEGCVAAAFAGAQGGCPLYKDVMVLYDLCQLRFSNRNFSLDDDYIVSTPPAEAFDAAVRLLVNATANYAAENSSRRFGTGEEGFDKKSRIYALAQCTPDKTADVCRTCLTTIANQLPTYFGGFNGGVIFGAWCSFRYELDPFFSGRPLLQLPAFVWTPPPPPPAPALPAITSQGNAWDVP